MITLMEFSVSNLVQWLFDHSDEDFVIVSLYSFTDYYGKTTYAADIKAA